MNPSLRRTLAVAALALTPVLASCGFDQPTDRVYNPGVGVNQRDGEVDVLNALIVSGAPGSGSVVATLSNNDTDEADRLVAISGAGDSRGLGISLERPLDIPRGGSVSVSDETEVPVEGDAVTSGAFVEITFTFDNAEPVTLKVPVVGRRGPYADIPVPSVAPPTDDAATEGSGH